MNTISFLTIPAAVLPDQEILVFNEQRHDYAALTDLVSRISTVFKQVGLQPNDVVAALDTNSDLYVASYYAAAKAGLTFLPINYRAKTLELEYMINTAKAKVLLVGDRYLDQIMRMRSDLTTIKEYLALGTASSHMQKLAALAETAAPDENEAEVDDQDVSVLMYTSGTTSLPKGVMLSFHDFTAYVTANVEMADGTDRGTALVCVPFYHIAGTTAMMTSIWTGRRMVVMPQFEATWLQLVAARAGHSRLRGADHDEATARRAELRQDRPVEPAKPGLRRRRDAAAGHPQGDRRFPENGRLRQRVRTDRNHLIADRARSRRPSAGGQPRGGRAQGQAA